MAPQDREQVQHHELGHRRACGEVGQQVGVPQETARREADREADPGTFSVWLHSDPKCYLTGGADVGAQHEVPLAVIGHDDVPEADPVAGSESRSARRTPSGPRAEHQPVEGAAEYERRGVDVPLGSGLARRNDVPRFGWCLLNDGDPGRRTQGPPSLHVPEATRQGGPASSH